MMTGRLPSFSKYRLTRIGRKLQVSEDSRALVALPKDIPERIWAECIQKEENDSVIFEIREEILQDALSICYNLYMEKQTTIFTVHCAALAWLKLIDWHFYRHDPGEGQGNYPPCYIPKRTESWMPDEMPEPSRRDPWCMQKLAILEDCIADEDAFQRPPSSDSIEMEVIDDIPEEYWFPGKVVMNKKPHEINTKIINSYQTNESTAFTEDLLDDSSEMLQLITNYSSEEQIRKGSSMSALKTTTPIEASLQGAGDCIITHRSKKKVDKSRIFSKNSVGPGSRSSPLALAPLKKSSRSRLQVNAVSDCRLRSPRMETQYEISPEKLNTPPIEPVKKK